MFATRGDFLIVELTDASGAVHRFDDKVQIFGCDIDVDQTTPLPVPGSFDCTIVEHFTCDGRELIRIDTEKPFDIEALGCGYLFVVEAETIIHDP